MNPEIQKKIDRIAELVRQRDAIDTELARILGVHIQVDVEHEEDRTVEPVIPVATRAERRYRPAPSYDKTAVEADLRAGMKPAAVAERHNVNITTVYKMSSLMKRNLGAPSQPKQLSADMVEQIQDLRDEEMTTTEIASELGLDFDVVASVPARGAKGEVSEP